MCVAVCACNRVGEHRVIVIAIVVVCPVSLSPAPVVLPMLYTAVVLPVQVFFLDNINVPGWIAVEVVISLFFLVDMLLNFNVATQRDDGKLELRRCHAV